MNRTTAEQVYSILMKEAGAPASMKNGFIYEFTKPEHTSEWRFQGKLGYGGKFRTNNNGVYVDFYKEDTSTQKDEIAKRINTQLNELNIKVIRAGGFQVGTEIGEANA